MSYSLEVLSPLCSAVVSGDLDLEQLVVGHERGQLACTLTSRSTNTLQNRSQPQDAEFVTFKECLEERVLWL